MRHVCLRVTVLVLLPCSCILCGRFRLSLQLCVVLVCDYVCTHVALCVWVCVRYGSGGFPVTDYYGRESLVIT